MIRFLCVEGGRWKAIPRNKTAIIGADVGWWTDCKTTAGTVITGLFQSHY
jgi:hypothetical protein